MAPKAKTEIKTAVAVKLSPEKLAQLTRHERAIYNLQQGVREFVKALGGNQLKAERFIRSVVTTIRKNAVDIEKCDPNDVYLECMKAAQDGLTIDGREAALVVYNEKVRLPGNREETRPVPHYMPMISGIIKRARNSGEISTVTAHIRFKKDIFKHVRGDDERIIHEPDLDGEDRGPPVGVYAIVRMRDGGIEREYMSHAEVMAVKNISKAKASGPWASAFEFEMWKKTVLRRVLKRCPASSELIALMERDDVMYDFSLEAEAEESGSSAAATPEPPEGNKRKGGAASKLATPPANDGKTIDQGKGSSEPPPPTSESDYHSGDGDPV